MSKIAANTAKEIMTDDTKMLYFPNTSSQESHIEVSTPECSFILPFRDLKPSMALVKLPSAAVLGMNVKHFSPKMTQTPPFSVNNMSKAILFWNAIREVEANWSWTASNPLCVQFPSFCTL
ncbi:hypothetical protein CHARACLAT_033266 [Characodon lateralis]|uniref:Uncharacterized protein n=1 Tax=Characodon lateralis TaxID=208331 RepID=A0ABU7CTC4_9TELE|nr:hypothetical protein [Characodon lateralis]